MTPPIVKWPDLHRHWRQAVVVARALNRAGISAFPLRSIPALSIETPPEYASGDEIVGPARRRTIRSALRSAGYYTSENGLLAADGWPALLEHPAPPDTFSEYPTTAIERIVGQSARIALLRPTQAVLLLLRKNSGRIEPPLQQELLHLVWEQSVDLTNVSLWAGAMGYRRLFVVLPALRARQCQGIELRRRGEFDSLLPR
ncbi:MAG: hypothetical protein KDA27_00800 [Candidatus Eisenbacteria bacterium]|uniref:Uncharacterized protein n=1 Tax=Eiseniibacteriota bacterium TaxID=2212470 RepID=A0A956SBE3_UNCEI|nr:hypothetical protein [Candidatus Eisenbacteria bacterium]MCB9462271.1 hypothetical protein [Candidatus Eisenbacteria bacterium]